MGAEEGGGGAGDRCDWWSRGDGQDRGRCDVLSDVSWLAAGSPRPLGRGRR